MQRFKSIVLLGISAVVLIAGLWLVVSNLTADWTLHFYSVDLKDLRRGGVLFVAALAGVAIYLLLRACLPAGYRALRQSRHDAQARSNRERLERLEAREPQDEGQPHV